MNSNPDSFADRLRARMRSFLRPPAALPPEQIRIILLIGAAFLLAGYDLNLLGLAMPRVQASLEIPEEWAGPLISVIRIGILGALILSTFADRFGRRRLLMVTIIGSAVATLLTALSQSPAEFAAYQGFVRVFGYAQDMISIVVIAEEIDERARGWALGLLAALGALGTGLASAVYALVDILPGDWRGLYVIGAIPLFATAWMWRTLPETRRFEVFAANRAALPHAPTARFSAVRGLWKDNRGRVLALVATVGPIAFGGTAAIVLGPKFLQSERGFGPFEVFLTYILAGLPATVIGNFLLGRLSDRLGRKPILIGCVAIFAIAFAFFYTVAQGIWLPIAWALGVTGFFGMEVVLSAYGAEIFATAHRSTASGIRLATNIVIGGIALIVQGALYGVLGSHGASIAILLPVMIVGVAVGIRYLPETAGRKLEDIAPDLPHH